MKFFLIMAFFLVLYFPLQAQELRVAVVDFKADGIDEASARRISELIRNEMIKSGRYRIIERTQIDKILTEQGFQLSGCTDSGCAVEIGKLLSANKMLVGTIMKIGNKIVITGRMVDVQSGSADFSADSEAKSENDLNDAVRKFSSSLGAAMEKKSGRMKTVLGDTISLEVNASYSYMDFIGISPTYWSDGRGMRYGWNAFTITFGNRLLQVGTTIAKYDGLHYTLFPLTAVIPIFLMPRDVVEGKGEKKADVVGLYLIGEWAYMNKTIRKKEMKPYFGGRLLWDIAMAMSAFAGVTHDGEVRYFAGASLKLGVGQYSSKPFF